MVQKLCACSEIKEAQRIYCSHVVVIIRLECNENSSLVCILCFPQTPVHRFSSTRIISRTSFTLILSNTLVHTPHLVTHDFPPITTHCSIGEPYVRQAHIHSRSGYFFQFHLCVSHSVNLWRCFTYTYLLLYLCIVISNT